MLFFIFVFIVLMVKKDKTRVKLTTDPPHESCQCD